MKEVQFNKAMRPPLVKLVNGIGPLWKILKFGYPTLDFDVLLKKARRRTGLNDMGDDIYQDAIDVLYQSIQEGKKLSHIGTFVASQMIYNAIENRLKLVDYFKRNPTIEEQEIKKPIFILGLPRTGTTLLHYLLALDPNHRIAKTWESFHPTPVPNPKSYLTDRRIGKTKRELFLFWNLVPNIRVIHDFDESTAQECIVFMGFTFISLAIGTQLFIPRYMHWLKDISLDKYYSDHKRMLQFYQSEGVKKERWLLKAPAHLYCVDSILKTYPDACIIQTHREPLKAVASSSSLNYALAQLTTDDLDPREVGPLHAEMLSDWMNLNVDQRKKNESKNKQFFDLSFNKFVHNPIEQIKSIYQKFDLEYTKEFEEKMKQFMIENPSGKHGKHIYTLEQFGISEKEHGSLFDAYNSYFETTLKQK